MKNEKLKSLQRDTEKRKITYTIPARSAQSERAETAEVRYFKGFLEPSAWRLSRGEYSFWAHFWAQHSRPLVYLPMYAIRGTTGGRAVKTILKGAALALVAGLVVLMIALGGLDKQQGPCPSGSVAALFGACTSH